MTSRRDGQGSKAARPGLDRIPGAAGPLRPPGGDDEEQRNLDELVRLQRDLTIAANETDLESLLERLLGVALTLDGVDSGGVYLREPATGALDLLVARGLSPEFVAAARHFEGETPQGRIAAIGEPLHIQYSATGFESEREGLKALAVVPVRHDGTVNAVFNLASRTHDQLPTFTRTALEMIVAVGGGAVARARTETALRESEERYRQVVELSPDPVVVLQDGRYAFVNHVFYELFGYSAEDVDAGLSFFELVDERDIPRVRERYEDRLAGKSLSQIFEIDMVAKDGTVVPCETSATLIQHRDRPADLVFIRDISERREAEGARQALEDKLRQAEKLEAIGQLAGGVAHDFNNQLAGIIGLSDMLVEDTVGHEPVNGYARKILTAASRAAGLTSQLLAFARKGRFLSVPVDIHRTIGEVVSLLHRSLDKQVIIDLQLDADPAAILGDPAQLQTALLNLALNARDAMADGGRLTFSTEVVEIDDQRPWKLPFEIEAGRFLRVAVSDEGSGISPDIEDRIFEPFFTTKDEGKGTGMGLAAVYGAVINHRGTLELKTTVGQGTTINLYLPIPSEEVTTVTGAPAPDRQPRAGGHVLLVDDEEIVLSTSTTMLKRLGYRVTRANSGREALAAYDDAWEAIDLVILDMVMPGLSGRETFLAMREINPDATVLLSSGFGREGEAQRIIALGVKGFLKKPYTTSELDAALAQVLGGEEP